MAGTRVERWQRSERGDGPYKIVNWRRHLKGESLDLALTCRQGLTAGFELAQFQPETGEYDILLTGASPEELWEYFIKSDLPLPCAYRREFSRINSLTIIR